MPEPLRILDLGAHDGFAGLHVQQQLGADAVVLDALELHPRGAKACKQRGYRHAIPADALQAPQLLEPGSYDAVIAYELIEHVPDPAELLRVCEEMLKPGGLIFISTPDGVFGEGGNPHHLRAYRSIDLAEVLRRRGRIRDLTSSPDGIIAASYQPAPRTGSCAIYAPSGWMHWSPLDITTRGLGGSETAAARLAEHLDSRGWVVTVYGDVDEGCYGNVVCRHHSVFDPAEPTDLFIASRVPQVFDRPIAAGRRMLWVHDTDCGPALNKDRAAQIDDVLCLSAWQLRHLAGMYPFLDGKLRRVRNGIHLPFFTGPADAERDQRVLYTSSPDRGLDVLLELWPAVREQVPGAVLAHCYAPVYDAIADQDPRVAAHRDRISELSDQDGVERLPGMSQPALARLMRESLVWAHPSWHGATSQPFHETSCIGAMEAMAAGLHVVASNWGALGETVQAGALIDGPMGERWREAFTAEIVRGLTDTQLQRHAQAAGPEAAAGLGWGPVAARIALLARGDMRLPEGLRPPEPVPG